MMGFKNSLLNEQLNERIKDLEYLANSTYGNSETKRLLQNLKNVAKQLESQMQLDSEKTRLVSNVLNEVLTTYSGGFRRQGVLSAANRSELYRGIAIGISIVIALTAAVAVLTLDMPVLLIVPAYLALVYLPLTRMHEKNLAAANPCEQLLNESAEFSNVFAGIARGFSESFNFLGAMNLDFGCALLSYSFAKIDQLITMLTKSNNEPVFNEFNEAVRQLMSLSAVQAHESRQGAKIQPSINSIFAKWAPVTEFLSLDHNPNLTPAMAK